MKRTWERVKSAIAATWRCAEKHAAQCPHWPVCGCDPQANAVIERLQTKGLLRDGRFVMARDEWEKRPK